VAVDQNGEHLVFLDSPTAVAAVISVDDACFLPVLVGFEADDLVCFPGCTGAKGESLGLDDTDEEAVVVDAPVAHLKFVGFVLFEVDGRRDGDVEPVVVDLLIDSVIVASVAQHQLVLAVHLQV
jgi:hypothetical protein